MQARSHRLDRAPDAAHTPSTCWPSTSSARQWSSAGHCIMAGTSSLRRWRGSACLTLQPEPPWRSLNRRYGPSKLLGMKLAEGTDGLGHHGADLLRVTIYTPVSPGATLAASSAAGSVISPFAAVRQQQVRHNPPAETGARSSVRQRSSGRRLCPIQNLPWQPGRQKKKKGYFQPIVINRPTMNRPNPTVFHGPRVTISGMDGPAM